MANLKQIKAKIKSVSNLKKITRALEIVSTVKLQKVKQQEESGKQYMIQLMKIFAITSQIIDIYGDNGSGTSSNKPTKNAVIVVTSERGLCGGLNTKLLRKVVQENDIHETDFFVIGKKGLEFLKRMNASIIGHISLPDVFQQRDLLALYTFIEGSIQHKAYKAIHLYFNYFKYSITQIPTNIQLFPFTAKEVQGFFDIIGLVQSTNETNHNAPDMIIEPSFHEVKTEMKRQMSNYIMMSTMLQNKTGEHASRMIAMKNAKDNATSFVKSLTLTFNKERQASITKEISEIVSAKIAIEG